MIKMVMIKEVLILKDLIAMEEIKMEKHYKILKKYKSDETKFIQD